jgi:hypothetical protein
MLMAGEKAINAGGSLYLHIYSHLQCLLSSMASVVSGLFHPTGSPSNIQLCRYRELTDALVCKGFSR